MGKKLWERIARDPQSSGTGIATAIVCLVGLFYPDIPEETRVKLVGSIALIGGAIISILVKDGKKP